MEDDGVALRTMDIFAGCGGLSEGFQQARAAVSKWAVEYEYPAAEAYKLNHPDATVFCDNCNVILHAAMAKAGLQDVCLASKEVRSNSHYSTPFHACLEPAAAASELNQHMPTRTTHHQPQILC